MMGVFNKNRRYLDIDTLGEDGPYEGRGWNWRNITKVKECQALLAVDHQKLGRKRKGSSLKASEEGEGPIDTLISGF